MKTDHILEVSHIYVAGRCHAYGAYPHTGHMRRSRIRAVSTDRYQTNISPSVTSKFMISFNRTQTSVFSLCTTKIIQLIRERLYVYVYVNLYSFDL